MNNTLKLIQQEIATSGGNLHVAYITEICDKKDCYFCDLMYREHIINKHATENTGWLPYEIKFVKDNWKKLSLRQMSSRLKKSKGAISKRGRLLQLGKKPHTYGKT